MDQKPDWQTRERIAVLETQFAAMQRDTAEMAADVKAILATLHEAKGGWRMILVFAGSAGLVGAFLGRWIAIFLGAIPT